ncbi:MAG TPA: hypothetical protein DEB17_00840 [Chlorobaculum sp.]|uniref:Uncharacterized protein n=1 Tax=Chlorobaculum tepidum (strain ATCC 49652 / DSM 12025 / NBRC 103806 / TLS) TaxID=194439 RepID=Q8KBT8_CHLTE|nr:hypothetical protein CT1694 [Chlorobaculum tepidum TLS]HBU22547.1 hypothetical protein [Chlorobaculum sp.]
MHSAPDRKTSAIGNHNAMKTIYQQVASIYLNI